MFETRPSIVRGSAARAGFRWLYAILAALLLPLGHASVAAAADLLVNMTPSPTTVIAGANVTYTIRVDNNAADDAANTVLTAAVPAGAQFVSVTPPAGVTCSYPTPATCALGTMLAGESKTIVLVLRLTTPPSVANTASVTTTSTDIDNSNNSISKTVTVITGADLTTSATGTPNPVVAGATVTYTVTSQNLGPQSATSIVVTNTLPANVTYASASGSGWTCSPSGQVVTCTRPGPAAVGNLPNITITGRPQVNGTITNTVSISAATSDADVSNNTSTFDITVNAGTDMSVTKTVSPNPAAVGSPVDWTITPRNNGPMVATDVTVTDPLPAGHTFVSVTPAECSYDGVNTVNCLFPGPIASATNLPVITLRTTPTVAGSHSNTVTVASAIADPNNGNNSATRALTVQAVGSDLTLTKSAAPAIQPIGGTVNYTLTARNLGPSPVPAGAVITVTDPVPAAMNVVSATGTGWTCGVASNTVTCTRSGPLALNATTPAITISATTLTAGVISNTACVAATGTAGDADAGNDCNTAATTTTATTADVAITQTAAPNPVAGGFPLTYTLTVTNNGPDPATSVVVNDTLATATFVSATPSVGSCNAASPVVCNLGTLANGASETIVIIIRPLNAPGTRNNTATVSSQIGDNVPGNNSSTIPVTITAGVDIQQTVVASPGTVLQGAPMTFVMTTRNGGPAQATGVTMTDTLPANIRIISITPSQGTCPTAPALNTPLAAPSTLSCTIGTLNANTQQTVTVVAEPTATGSYTNSASSTSAGVEFDLSNNSASAGYTVTPPQVDLSVIKIDTIDPVAVNTDFQYAITVTNNGPSRANNVVLTENTPPQFTYVGITPSKGSCAGTAPILCAIGTMAAGETVTLSLTMTASTVGSYVNNASVAADETDTNPLNDTTNEQTTAKQPVDLAITKTGTPNPVRLNENITFLLTVTNGGPATSVITTVNDTLPAGLSFVSATPSQGTCGSSSPLTCAIGSMLSGGSATISLVARANAVGGFTNTATVTSSEPDIVPGNNTSSFPFTVAPIPDLTITKTHTGNFPRGGTGTFDIGVLNVGGAPTDGTTITVSDTLPAGYTPTTAIGTGWNCTVAAPTVTCTRSDVLNNGASFPTIAVTVAVANNAAASITNIATVAGGGDNTPGNNSASDPVTNVLSLDLTATNTNGLTALQAGQSTTYTIVFSNLGPGDGSGATVSSVPPVVLTGVTWTCVGSGGAVCPVASGSGAIAGTVPTFPSGGVLTYSLTATVLSTATGTVVVPASVTVPAGATDPTPGNNTATDTDPLTPTADLSITKTSAPTSYVVGSPLTYTIVATNAGPVDVTGATIADTVPAPLGAFTWSCTSPAGACGTGTGTIAATVTLNVGQSATITLTGTVPNGTTGAIVNTATVAPPGGIIDPVPSNNTATNTNYASGTLADVQITNTDGVTTVVAGGVTTYTVVVTNAGPSAVTAALVNDAAPAGLTFGAYTCVASAGSSCPASGTGNLVNVPINLLVGGTATFTIPATVSYTAASPLTTTATVALPGGMVDPTPGNNIATDVDTVTPPASPVADIAVTKTDGVTSISAGSSTVYTIVATNNGPNAANNSTIVDAVAAGLTKTAVTCSAAGGAVCPAGLTVSQLEAGVAIATWPSGGSLTLTVTATVTVPNGSVTNVVSVAVPTGIIDPNLANNTATDVDTVTPPAATDLTIHINDGQTEILPGQALTYTIPVTNLGPGAVIGALVQSTPPAGVTFGAWTCVASAGSSCPASGNGNISTPVTLLAGGTLTYTVAATVSPTATGSIATTATVTPPAGVVDPTPANNTATDIDVIAPQRIDVEKRAGTPRVVGPATFEIPYTITVTNAGRVPATNVQVSDSLSAVFTAGNPALTMAAPATASPTGGASTAQCIANTAFNGLGALETATTNLLTGSATLSGSQGCSITFTVRVAYENAAAVPREPQANRAEGYSSTAFAGSHASVDDGSAEVVLRLPRVDITKALTGVTQLGDDPAFDVSYALVVRNTGEVPATNVQIADDLARVFAAGSPTITLPVAPAFGDGNAPLTMAGDFNGTSKTALLSGSDTIAPNTARTIRLTVRVRYASTLQIPVNQDIVNSARATTSVTPGGVVISTDDSTDVTETPADPSAGDVPVATAVRFTPKPRLSITKTASLQVVEVGDQVSYAVRVSNLGGPALPATVVTDRLPVGFRYVPGSARLSSGAAVTTTAAATATPLPDPAGAPGPVLGFSLPAQPTTDSVTLTYRLHVGPGALQGTGVNSAEAATLGAGAVRSNVAHATVAISGGVFTQDACVIGKVFTDLNGNRIQDENEPGIPGVLVRFEEGTGLVSDSEGKYSFCGLTPTTHVLKVDRQTLPAGARLVTSGNRNGGDANSLFVDLKYGEVRRADFIEASGDPQVMAEIEARRAQPEVWRPVLESQPLSVPPTRSLSGRSLLAVPAGQATVPALEGFTPVLHVAPLDSSTANVGDSAPRALDADGANVGVIRLSAERGSAAAGNSAPTRLTIRLLDADGNPLSSSVVATVELSEGQVLTPGNGSADDQRQDAGSVGDDKAPGTQVRIDGGEATVDLVVQPTVRDLQVRVTAGDATADGTVSFVPAAPPMMAVGIVEGRMALTHLDPTAIEPIRAGAAFERELTQFSRDFSAGDGQVAGRAALFMKGMVKGDYLLTLAYDSEKQGRGVLFRDIQPDAFYPVYGDASLKNFDAQTSGRFYLRAERGRTYLLYGDMQTAGSSTEARNLGVYSRTLTGVQQHFQNRMAMVNLFASRDSLTRVIDEMSGLGTSGPYAVSNANGVWGTEKVEIVTRDRNQPAVILNVETLSRFTDYEYEPFTRRLLLRRPVPSMDDSLNPVSLRVTYEVDRGGEKSWVSGGDGAVNLGRFVQVGGSWAEDRAPQSPYRLRSVNGSVRFGTTTTFVAEAAQSLGTVNTTTFNQTGLLNLAGVSGSVDGTAVRAELRHQSARAKARLFAGTSDAGFNNPSSTLTGGRTEIGGRGSLTLTPPLSLVGEVVHSEDRLIGGRRQGGSVGLNARLSRRLLFEVGMRRATETVTPAQGTSVGTSLFGLDALDGFGLGAGVSTSIDPVTGLPLVNPGYAPQLSAAATSAPQAPAPLDLLSARTKLTLAFSDALRVYGEAEQDVRDTDKRMLALGGQFQIAERARVYLRHEFISSLDGPYALSDRQRRYNTVFGVSSSYLKNSDVFSEYRMRDAMSGREAHAAIGLRNRWPLATGVALSTTVERLHAIAGIDQEATAASLGLEYTRNPRLKGSGRLEWRRAPSADSWLSTAGLARKLSRDWTLLSKNYLQRMSPKSGPEQMQDRFWFGGAYRDTTKNRVNLLSRYEFRFENTLGQAVASIGTGTWRKVQAVSTHIDVHPSARWTWEGQHAAKWVDDRTEGLSRVMTQLVSGRVGYDLTRRFDLAGLGSLMWSGVGGRQYAVGGELGALLRDNLWLSFGYNILGFTDRDMIAVEQTSRGGFIRLRMKFDENLLRGNDTER